MHARSDIDRAELGDDPGAELNLNGLRVNLLCKDFKTGSKTAYLKLIEGARPPAVLGLARARVVKASCVDVNTEVLSTEGGEELGLDTASTVLRGHGKESEGFESKAPRAPQRGPFQAGGPVAEAALIRAEFELRDELEMPGKAEVGPKQRTRVGVVVVLAFDAQKPEANLELARLCRVGVGRAIRGKGRGVRAQAAQCTGS